MTPGFPGQARRGSGLCFSDPVFRQRYDDWRVLGRGRWASVVRARSRDLGHEIALKVFVNLDPELLERVRREVCAVLALSTPYLVHTYTLFDRGTIAWFEMELVDGPNLQRELDRLAAAGELLPLGRAYDGRPSGEPITSPLQLGLVADPRKATPEAVDFAEEARLTRDDFGNWGVSYNHDSSGPRWRFSNHGTPRGDR